MEKSLQGKMARRSLKPSRSPLAVVQCTGHSSKSHVGTPQRTDPVKEVKEEEKGKGVITHGDDLVEETSSK